MTTRRAPPPRLIRCCLLAVRLAVVIVCGPGAGCGDPAAPTAGVSMPSISPDFREGLRLKFPIWKTADGFVQQQGRIRDSARGEDCAFVRATDGKLRCMPTSTAAYFAGDRPVFADARCMQPLAMTWDQTPPYLRAQHGTTACSTDHTFEYFQLGASFEGDEIFVIDDTDGACQPSVRSRKIGYRLMGPAVRPDQFVAAEEVVTRARSGARMALVTLHAEDGAQFKMGLRDEEQALRCDPLPAGDGVVRCLPNTRYFTGVPDLHEGADCTGPTLASQEFCIAHKAQLVADFTAECPRRLLVHSPGPVWEGALSMRDATERCVAVPNRAEYPRVQIGPELDPKGFVPLQLDRSGPGRLRASRYTDDTGAAVPESSTRPYDSLLESLCEFKVGDDGQARCVPPLLTPLFSDSACTRAVAAVSLTPDTCASGPGQNFLMVGRRLHRNGLRLDQVPARPLFLLSSASGPGSCGDATYLTDPNFGFAMFAVGAEVAIDLVTASATETASGVK